jgi:hypothetical protein
MAKQFGAAPTSALDDKSSFGLRGNGIELGHEAQDDLVDLQTRGAGQCASSPAQVSRVQMSPTPAISESSTSSRRS